MDILSIVPDNIVRNLEAYKISNALRTMSTNQAMDIKENIDDSESIASDDSDEMTEVDECEFDHRRAACVANMKSLELQFAKLKEELIKEKNNEVEKKLKEIEDETAEEFLVPLKKLQMNMDFKIKLTTLMRDYRWNNIEHIYACEKDSSKLTLENDMQSLLDKYKANIENEIRQLEENRRQFLLDYELHQLQGQVHAENDDEPDDQNELNEFENEELMIAQQVGSFSRNEEPYIVYNLHDQDILEDWFTLKMFSDLNRTVTSC